MEKALSEWKEKETTQATELAREYSVLRSITEKQATNKRFKLMKAKKGQYTFTWKHERLSWRAATCPVYFDTGKGFLFERKSNGIFIKISKSDFPKVHI